MTIEQLENLKNTVKRFPKHIDDTKLKNAEVIVEPLCELIDAEIERQSVTDVDVEQAIKEIGLINHPEFAIWEKRTVDALNIAIEALRQYRKPEPCDMCKRDENGAGIIVDNMWKWNSETKKRYPMLAGGLANYCPRCGRKLEGEE